MNCYAKAILYIYSGIEGVVKQIDDIVLQKALASFSDTTSCLSQAERIVENIRQKELLLELKSVAEAALASFSEEEMKYFEYKYFKRKPKSYFENFDVAGRKYFRTQIRLLERFCKNLERKGLNEEAFCRDYLPMEFIRELVRRIEKSEEKAEQIKLLRLGGNAAKRAAGV
ncbi:MAG: hypothetical protein DBX59_10660 [Bacillota bacterium]|nr:MAG: hypothetical protein DBX59_10660 [Bacillota bacterium]